MKTLIRNATVVLPDAIERINVLIDGQTIVALDAADSTTADEFWKGKIAVAQIYNRALSASEVLQNYNATKGRFGL